MEDHSVVVRFQTFKHNRKCRRDAGVSHLCRVRCRQNWPTHGGPVRKLDARGDPTRTFASATTAMQSQYALYAFAGRSRSENRRSTVFFMSFGSLSDMEAIELSG